MTPFAPIDDVLADLRAGKMVILTDDEDRENEGDIILPAEHLTPEAVTFMLSVARGYMCLSLTEHDCDRLDLHPQSAINTTTRGTAFTVSVDGAPRHGFTTGVSAAERAKCIRMMIDERYGAADFVRPGHVNPLRSRDGGVLVRAGQTEGSVDLCRLAGLYPAAVIIEIMRDDGEMARLPDLVTLAEQHGLKLCSVAQIIEHRLARQSLVRRLDPIHGATIQTPYGPFNLIAFSSLVDRLPHLALTAGGVGKLDDTGEPIADPTPTLVRMHRRDLLGDIFGVGVDGKSPTADLLHASMKAIQREGRGAIVYLRPDGAHDAPDLSARLSAFAHPNTQPQGAPDPDIPDLAAAAPSDMDVRAYGVGGQILRALGLSNLRLLTNSTANLPGLDAFNLHITERVPL
ncbi:MAG: 3,4-dihydroxy-2-butanone-4-phosphate synthase [Phycisphaerae bacterium]|nr:3,4-dihydroxy-2-butanone-4-phosphate synthase [Phycisphaerae bacterium]